MVSKIVYDAKIRERIRVQEEIVTEELERLKQYPKLTYKQRWQSILNRCTNDASALRRTHNIELTRNE